MPHNKRDSRITTTVGELANAFYEAALAELKDKGLAARVAQQMVKDAMSRQTVAAR